MVNWWMEIHRVFNPAVTIDAQALDLTVSATGELSYLVPGQSARTVITIEIAIFKAPEFLEEIASGIYRNTDAGTGLPLQPGAGGGGTLQLGAMSSP